MAKRKTRREFIDKARQRHGFRYGYERVAYINNHTKVLIRCPIHGYFGQTPNSHISGKGCLKCGVIRRSESKKQKARNRFAKRADEIHNGRYDYSFVEYVDNKTKVSIICSEHGPFEQVPGSHLSGRGCPWCAGRRNWTKRKVIDEVESLIDKRASLQLIDIKTSKMDLYRASVKLFGSWRNLLCHMGVDYESIRSYAEWDRHKVKSEILLHHESGALSYTDDYKLYKAAKRQFGSWQSALEACGLDADDGRRIIAWDEEKIIAAIQDAYDSGEPVSSSYMSGTNCALRAAGNRWFGSWNEALRAAGFDPVKVAGRPFRGTICCGEDGNIYRSRFERMVGDQIFLLKQQGCISNYRTQVRVCSDRRWTCDFVLMLLGRSFQVWLEADGLGSCRIPVPYGDKHPKIQYYQTKRFDFEIVGRSTATQIRKQLKEIVNVRKNGSIS